MAITFVATSTNFAAPAASLTIGVPAGVVDDDFLIARLAVEGTTTPVDLLAGWTEIHSLGISGNGVVNHRVFYRVASSEPANYTWTLPASNNVAGEISAFRSTTPPISLDQHGIVSYAYNTNPIDAPSLVASGSNEMLVCLFSEGKGDQLFSTPTGMTEIDDFGTGSGGGVSVSSYYESIASSGATGVRTTTMSGSGSKRESIASSILLMDGGGGCRPSLAATGVGCK